MSHRGLDSRAPEDPTVSLPCVRSVGGVRMAKTHQSAGQEGEFRSITV